MPRNFNHIVKEVLVNLVQKTRKNGEKFWTLKDGSPGWQLDLIRLAHPSQRLPDDHVYYQIWNILTAWDDRDVQDRDHAYEVLTDIEPYIYTKELTEWLNSHTENIFYLEDAVTELGAKEGFQILACAHKLFIEQIGFLLIEVIEQESEND